MGKATKKSGRPWDRAAFFSALRQLRDPRAIQVAESMATWMERNADRIEGPSDRTVSMRVGGIVPCMIWDLRQVVIYFQSLMLTPAFKAEMKRVDLLTRLNEIDGVNFPEDKITKNPSIKLRELSEGTRFKDLLAVMDWVVSELKKGD